MWKILDYCNSLYRSGHPAKITLRAQRAILKEPQDNKKRLPENSGSRNSCAHYQRKKSTEQEYCSSKDNTLETTAAKNAETCVVLSQDHLDVPLCFWEHVLRAVEKKVDFFCIIQRKNGPAHPYQNLNPTGKNGFRNIVI